MTLEGVSLLSDDQIGLAGHRLDYAGEVAPHSGTRSRQEPAACRLSGALHDDCLAMHTGRGPSILWIIVMTLTSICDELSGNDSHRQSNGPVNLTIEVLDDFTAARGRPRLA